MRPFVAFGEALWDLFPDGAVLGGAPLNFAYRVQEDGGSCRMITALGTDERGDAALERIRELGMSTGLIQRLPDRPTGSVEVTLDEERNPTYRIVPGVAYDAIEVTDEAMEAAREAGCICFGTLAQREERSRTTIQRLLEEATDAERLYDVNLRPGSVVESTIRASLERSTIVKINDEEAATLNKMLGLGAKAADAFCEGLCAAFPVQLIVVTLGAGGAYARHRSGEEHYEAAFRVEVADPCGAGDAFTAAFTTEYLETGSLEAALRRGNAYGAAVASRRGATDPIPRSALEALINTDDRLAAADIPISLLEG
jgi:fructokinase